jgi:hypothetical protein
LIHKAKKTTAFVAYKRLDCSFFETTFYNVLCNNTKSFACLESDEYSNSSSSFWNPNSSFLQINTHCA